MKTPLTTINRFWNLLSSYKSEIRQIYIYAIFIGLVNLSLPLGIQAIVNYLQTGELTSSWIILVCFVLLGISVNGLVQVLQLRIVENIQQDIFSRSAFEFAFRLPKIRHLEMDQMYAPEVVNRFFDTVTIQKGLPKILIDFSLAAFQIIFGLILLAIYSPFFIILGVVLIMILWAIIRFIGPGGLKTSLKESKYKYQLAHWLEEIGRVSRSFKLNTSNQFHLQKTDIHVVHYLSARENHFQVLIQQFRLFIGLQVFVAAGLLLLGGFLVFQDQLNIGQFVAAEIIIILIINSIEKILRVLESIYDVMTALEKIGFVSDLELDKESGNSNIRNTGPLSIRTEHLQFGFPNDKYPIIEDLSFELVPNAKVLLCGKTGSGKTLLLQIIAGIYEATSGEIYLDGIPLPNYKRDELYRAIGMAFPGNQIFEGTFRENICMGRALTDNRIWEILDLLELRNYFNQLPMGIDSHIDTGGRRLPRSIIQKLVIARIIADEPGLLLLEDPLQFLDEKEKIRIIDYLMAPERNWTVIVVGDHPYWKEKCDHFIELKAS